jgi:hypothetical protein
VAGGVAVPRKLRASFTARAKTNELLRDWNKFIRVSGRSQVLQPRSPKYRVIRHCTARCVKERFDAQSRLDERSYASLQLSCPE